MRHATDLGKMINTASGRPHDKALRLARTCVNFDIPDGVLGSVPQKCMALSRATGSKLQKICTGELGRDMSLENEKWMKQDRFIPGVLILRIAHYHRFGNESENPDRSVKFLQDSVKRCRKRWREDKNR